MDPLVPDQVRDLKIYQGEWAYLAECLFAPLEVTDIWLLLIVDSLVFLEGRILHESLVADWAVR